MYAARCRRRHDAAGRRHASARCASASIRPPSDFRRHRTRGVFNVFSLGANASYDFDLFGGTRRALEAAGAEVDLQRFELQAARLVLEGNVVLTAIRIASLDAQIGAVEALLALERERLAITEAAARPVASPRSTCRSQRVALAQAEVRRCRRCAPSASRRCTCSRCSAGGRRPKRCRRCHPFRAFKLPPSLPLRLPSDLARNRPDIRASEALMHEASANLGVATADLYPRFVVSGSFSTSRLEMSELFGNGINVWNIGLNLLQPLLRGGELKARQRAAAAAYDQAAAAYRQSVLHGAAGGRRRLARARRRCPCLCPARRAGGARRRVGRHRARPLRCRRRQPARAARRRAPARAGRPRSTSGADRSLRRRRHAAAGARRRRSAGNGCSCRRRSEIGGVDPRRRDDRSRGPAGSAWRKLQRQPGAGADSQPRADHADCSCA